MGSHRHVNPERMVMTDSSNKPRADIAILWSIGETARCVLARVDCDFEIRVVRGDAVMRCERFDDVAPALAKSAGWRREFSEDV